MARPVHYETTLHQVAKFFDDGLMDSHGESDRLPMVLTLIQAFAAKHHSLEQASRLDASRIGWTGALARSRISFR